MNIKGKKSVDSIHKELGHIMWEYVGMGRTAEGLKEGLKKLKEVRKVVRERTVTSRATRKV